MSRKVWKEGAGETWYLDVQKIYVDQGKKDTWITILEEIIEFGKDWDDQVLILLVEQCKKDEGLLPDGFVGMREASLKRGNQDRAGFMGELSGGSIHGQ